MTKLRILVTGSNGLIGRTFIETYKNYLESIGKYFVEVWIPELEEKNLKISSIKNEATHRIEERVSKMWDKHLGV